MAGPPFPWLFWCAFSAHSLQRRCEACPAAAGRGLDNPGGDGSRPEGAIGRLVHSVSRQRNQPLKRLLCLRERLPVMSACLTVETQRCT